ncbi:MAG: metallophosphoesterase [Gammaproteobacteria bacterium]|nr:metallophosphoesterase [Gammaproteobacteria bacterium]
MTATPIAIVTMLAAVLTGCSHEPVYRVELPSEVAVGSKSIAIVGDTQLTPPIVRALRRREYNETEQAELFADLRARIDEISALVVVGDLVFTARSERDWRHFDALIEPFASEMPVLPAIGNHDYPCFFVYLCRKSRIARRMQARFPWFEPGRPYSVSSSELKLLFLDSESRLDEQGAWLARELDAAAQSHRAALVFFHRPAYTHSIDQRAAGSAEVQQHIVPVLRSAALPIVAISGHVHGLEVLVVDGVHYLTTAGGGGSRGLLGPERPGDAYRGPDCRVEDDGAVLRPFNYLVASVEPAALVIEIRGFCRGDGAVRLLDSVEIPL